MDTEIRSEPVQNPSFDEQFSNKKTLENPVGNMQYVEVKSSFPSPTDSTRLVVFSGWSITLETEKKLLKQLSSGVSDEKRDPEGKVFSHLHYGRDIVSGEFPRRGGRVEEKDGIPSELVRQAELVSSMLLLQNEKVDISADSMAAMSLIAAIKIHPEVLDKIRNILIVSPAGFSGNDNFLKLVGRSLMHFGQDTLTFAKSPVERSNILKMGLEMAMYVGKNPPRTIKEVDAIAKSDEFEGLKTLKEELDKKGIMLGFIQAESDKLTPAKALWERIGEDSDPNITILTQEMYEKDYDRYDDLLLQPGDKIWNRDAKSEQPPMDFITMVGGGHDNRLYAEDDFGIKILRGFEELNKMRENESLFIPEIE